MRKFRNTKLSLAALKNLGGCFQYGLPCATTKDHCQRLADGVAGLLAKAFLESIGFENIHTVRVGKLIEIDLELNDNTLAEAKVHEMCDKMLTNPVVESYSFEIKEA